MILCPTLTRVYDATASTAATTSGITRAAAASTATARSHGGRHRLGDFWTERPVIVVFLRHFG